MAYRFRSKDRSVEHALKRIAREQVDKAIASIGDDKEQAHAIHEVRRRCKKLRGLIRLVGPSFEAFVDENADFREIGRLLGGLREAKVLKDTFDELVRHEPIDKESLRHVRHALQTHQTAEHSTKRLGEVRERLIQARRRVTDWTLAADGWAAIGSGLMQTQLRARRALDRIGESHAPEKHHDLRKQVKYHWHHMRLLRQIAPREIRSRADLAADLEVRLGEHHDLAMLEAALHGGPRAFDSEETVEVTLLLARRRRVFLERRCLGLARRLLAEDAESVSKRLGAEWAAWSGRHDR